MAKTVNTGWREVTPGECLECGCDDEWQCDGRGNVLCSCQGCPECGLASAYGFHEPGCPELEEEFGGPHLDAVPLGDHGSLIPNV